MSPTPQTHRTSDAHELCTIYNLSSICHELFHLYITNSTDTQTHRPAHECPAYVVSHLQSQTWLSICHDMSQTPTTIINSRETQTCSRVGAVHHIWFVIDMLDMSRTLSSISPTPQTHRHTDLPTSVVLPMLCHISMSQTPLSMSQTPLSIYHELERLTITYSRET